MATIYESAAMAGVNAVLAAGHQKWVDDAGSIEPFKLIAVAVIAHYDHIRDIADMVRHIRTSGRDEDLSFAARAAMSKFDRDGNDTQLTDAEMKALRESAAKAVPF